MSEYITNETIYVGSKDCHRCGKIMAPVEAMYSHDGKTCSNCRNAKMQQHVKQGMSE